MALRDPKPVRDSSWPYPWSFEWIAGLAEPYLRGYAPQTTGSGGLAGYRFIAPERLESEGVPAKKPSSRALQVERRRSATTGFFVGYLLAHRDLHTAQAEPPECLVFWFVEPAKGKFHRMIVEQPGSLARTTAEYIRWLTHRPPRFELSTSDPMVLVRHTSMSQWPKGKVGHFSRNFFIETLAWLVRSGLVKRLPKALGGLGAGEPGLRGL